MAGDFLYNRILMPLALPAFRLAALWDDKAREAVEGRRGWEKKLAAQLVEASSKRIILHAPSVGEFLQGRAVLDVILEKHPEFSAVVTHFSPSAGKIVAAYKNAAAHCILPLDTEKNARRFLDMVNPSIILFSRADVWPNLARHAAQRGMPAALVAASLSEPKKGLISDIQRFSRRGLKYLSLIAAVSEEDARLFRRHGVDISIIEVTGDPRYDQTWDRAKAVDKADPLFRPFPKKQFTLVAGSVWPGDDDVLLPAYSNILKNHPDSCLIIAPHEPTPEHIEMIRKVLTMSGTPCATLNELESAPGDGADLSAVIIDRVGALGKLYMLGDAAFVGGGFVRRVHNVMEPACFGLPVVVGPRHRNSREAIAMIKAGGCFAVSNGKELFDLLERFINDGEFRRLSGEKAMNTVKSGRGAAMRTFETLRKRFPDIFTG